MRFTAQVVEENVTWSVLQRIREYAEEYHQEHGGSYDKALAEAVRLLELEITG